MRLIIASHTHSLLPFAWRLHKEGHDITVIVNRDRFEKAWEGLLPKAVRKAGKGKAEVLQPLVDEAKDGTPVLTDSPRFAEVFAESPFLFTNPRVEGLEGFPSVLVGGWFTGERFVLPHLLVLDWGLWPSGMGPLVPGGATLVQPLPSSLSPLLEDRLDELKSANHRGLVGIGLQADPETQELRAAGMVAGWTYLQSHLFVSDLVGFGDLLAGLGAGFTKRFIVGVPVTVPPFPIQCNVSSVPMAVGGLDGDDHKSIFFHDMAMRDGNPYVAGTDGQVAVVRGSANILGLARQRALTVAGKMQLPHKQFRPDVWKHRGGPCRA